MDIDLDEPLPIYITQADEDQLHEFDWDAIYGDPIFLNEEEYENYYESKIN